MDLTKLITTRRSVREFRDEDVSNDQLNRILEAARWAPSGLNNQCWRFIIVKDDKLKSDLAKLTTYGDIIRSAKINILVFMDVDSSYDQTKDILSIGACIQNMLLTAHDLGLGSCWLGEILKNRDEVKELCALDNSWELMAVIALGHPVDKKRSSDRMDLKDLVFER